MGCSDGLYVWPVTDVLAVAGQLCGWTLEANDARFLERASMILWNNERRSMDDGGLWYRSKSTTKMRRE